MRKPGLQFVPSQYGFEGKICTCFPNVSNSLLKTLKNSKNVFLNHGSFKGFEIKYLISVMMFKYGNAFCSALRAEVERWRILFLPQMRIKRCDSTLYWVHSTK